MLKPGLTFVLWVAGAVLIVLNNIIGDTIVGAAIGPRLAAWYKVLVPLPYVALLAAIHARRTAGPQWLTAALLASVCWASSTALLDAAYGRVTWDEGLAELADRYGVLWGAPLPLLLLAQALLPPAFAWFLARVPRGSRQTP